MKAIHVEMCITMCLNVFVCVCMCIERCRSTQRHLHRHVCRHVDGYVYRHVHMVGMCGYICIIFNVLARMYGLGHLMVHICRYHGDHPPTVGTLMTSSAHD